MESLPEKRGSDIPSLSLISQALTNNVPAETLERVFALYERDKANYAKEQYDIAMSQFQAECPFVDRRKAVPTKSGALAYKYAPIEDVIREVRPTLNKYRFSYSFQTQTFMEKGTAQATCYAKHVGGHQESRDYELPFIERTGLMTMAHVVEGTITMCCRKAFCAVFGIITAYEDNNGAVVTLKPTQEEIEVLTNLLNKCNITVESILVRYKLFMLEDMDKGLYDRLVTFCERKLEANNGA